MQNLKITPINLGILGCGTVGGGLLDVLRDNRSEIIRRAGCQFAIKRVAVRSLLKSRECMELLPEQCITNDPWQVVEDPEIQIVVEVIGGDTIAKDLVLRAIDTGKHIVTANKALLAAHGGALFSAAERQEVCIGFEGAVAGGIPIIKALREGLVANRIEWVAGIVNGTCNYILSEMNRVGTDFSVALQQAQALGYAEVDPTLDIDGVDASHKLAILATVAFGIPIDHRRVYVEGIGHLKPLDMLYAAEFGYDVKLIALAKKVTLPNEKIGIELRVHPTLVRKHSIMASVGGAMNALMVKGDVTGTTFYYGAGAGAKPTASALIADLIDIAKHLNAAAVDRQPCLAFLSNAVDDIDVLPMAALETSYYLRLRVLDRLGTLAKITRILADQGISIESMLQKEALREEGYVDLIIFTHTALEQCMESALRTIEALSIVHGKIIRLRREVLM